MARKHSPVISKECFRPAPQLLFRTKIVDVAMYLPDLGIYNGKVRPLTGNLNLIDFISQVLRCQGAGRGKSMYFKALDLCLVNTT